MELNKEIKRGQVWWYNRKNAEPGITNGTHPCIIVSSDEWNAISGSVIVVPCTSDILKGTLKNCNLNLKDTSGYVFPTQITAVPKCNIFSYQGTAPAEEMIKIEDALTAILGMNSRHIDTYISTTKEVTSKPADNPKENFHKNQYTVYNRGNRTSYSKPSITTNGMNKWN